MSVLITGNTGYLGGYLVRYLEEKKEISVFSDGKKRDIRNFKDVKEKTEKIETIFHLAALLNYRNDEKNMYSVNVGGTLNVLEAARQSDVENIVYISSQDVYGEVENPNIAVKENSPTHPITAYGETKFNGEKHCRDFIEKYGLKIAILRPSVIYGPYMSHDSLLYEFIQSATKDRNIKIFGFGDRIYDAIYIEDIIKAIVKLEGKKGIFNIGGGYPYTTRSIAEAVNDLVPCKIEYNKDRKEIRGFYLDNSKIISEIGYNPTSIEEGLRKTLEVYYGK